MKRPVGLPASRLLKADHPMEQYLVTILMKMKNSLSSPISITFFLSNLRFYIELLFALIAAVSTGL